MQGKLKAIEWLPEYNLNVKTIDETHSELVNLLNRLINQINENACPGSMSEIFFALIHYAERFLIREEIFFRDLKYPHLGQHMEKHRFFIDKIKSFQEKFSTGDPSVCMELYDFLMEWFHEHVLKYDKETIAFLKEKGIS